ncbi:MAG: Hsp20/alpha crystallin family protein [Mariniblastus sp.]|nr:Hsp20/alpha crystallin family protein [Mariniblastus sp.]
MKHRSANGKQRLEWGTELDSLLGHFMRDRGAATAGWAPLVNANESETGYLVQMELPGVDASQLNIEMKEGHLEIWGEKQVEQAPEGHQLLRGERYHGKFKRSFEFSTPIDADRIEAEFKHGVLNISLPKSEKALPRKIEVKVSA